jgi:hypothetical protein
VTLPSAVANVTAVEALGSANSYNFSVTLETDDIDCSQFADWWEVLTEEGELIYRRILTHPHTEGLSGNPFTRSGGTVNVAPDQTVIVRAHMNNTGYGGMAMRGTAEGGFEPAPDIGPNFAPDVAAEGEQPGECTPEEEIMGF